MTEYKFKEDRGVLIDSEEIEDYFSFMYDLREGLASQADIGEERLSVQETRENDERLDLPKSLFREDELEDVFRYRIEDESRTAYLFDHHDGSILLGDRAMAATASESFEEFYYST